MRILTTFVWDVLMCERSGWSMQLPQHVDSAAATDHLGSGDKAILVAFFGVAGEAGGGSHPSTDARRGVVSNPSTPGEALWSSPGARARRELAPLIGVPATAVAATPPKWAATHGLAGSDETAVSSFVAAPGWGVASGGSQRQQNRPDGRCWPIPAVRQCWQRISGWMILFRVSPIIWQRPQRVRVVSGRVVSGR